jgi:hypothetical protein
MWQVYDWYLRPNAGYYFAKKASSPVHVQIHPETHAVMGVNETLSAMAGLALRVRLLDGAGYPAGELSLPVSLEPERSSELLRLDQVPGWSPDTFRFVRLDLVDSTGAVVADNFYWLAPGNDFTGLNALAPVELGASVTQERRGDQLRITLEITNPSDHLAFFVRPVLDRGPGGEEVLPTFWSDAYFSLLPGERKTVVAHVDRFRLGEEAPAVRLEGWNLGG